MLLFVNQTRTSTHGTLTNTHAHTRFLSLELTFRRESTGRVATIRHSIIPEWRVGRDEGDGVGDEELRLPGVPEGIPDAPRNEWAGGRRSGEGTRCDSL